MRQNLLQRGNLLVKKVDHTNKWMRELFGETDESYALQTTNGVLAKLYDDDINQFKLNDTAEFIGILHYVKTEKTEEEVNKPTTEEKDDFDTSQKIPNDEKTPHIHVISFIRDPFNRFNPLLQDISFKIQKDENSLGAHQEEISETKEQIMAILTKVFGGDETTAEHFILSLLSQPHLRKDGITVGQFPLNISNSPHPGAKNVIVSKKLAGVDRLSHALNYFMEQVLPHSIGMSLDIESLMNTRFSPKKNYTTNSLEQGLFQAIEGTTLLVDETKMQQGNLKDVGVENVQSLANLIQNQTVVYDYEYHKAEFASNLPVIVVSEGRSMFRLTNQIPLNPTEKLDFTVLEEMTQEQLRRFRRYFMVLRSEKLTFQITDEVRSIFKLFRLLTTPKISMLN